MKAGVFDGISRRTIDALKKHVPCLPIHTFADAVAIYRIERARRAVTPKSARDQLDKLADDALRLSAAISSVTSADGVRSYFRDECLAVGEPMFPVHLCDELRRLAAVAEMARRAAEGHATAGSGLSNRTKLIHRLAWELERAGQKPDYRVNGPLVLAFGIAMSELGESLSDHKSTVRSALETYQGKQ